MKKKILFVLDERKTGGVAIFLENILKNFNYEMYDVDVIVLANHGNRLESIPSNVNVHFGSPYFEMIDSSIKDVIKTLNPVKILKKARIVFDMKFERIEKKIKKERKKMNLGEYDVEIAFKDGFTALFTAYGNTQKKIHWLHYEYGDANPNKKYPNLFNKTMQIFDEIIAVSTGVLESFLEEYDVSSKTKIIHNFIDCDKILNLAKEDVFITSSKISVCIIARMHPVKALPRLINVIQRLNEAKVLEDIKFYFVGGGPEYDAIEKLINEKCLMDKIVLMGEKPNPYYILKAMDLLVSPSFFESFGMVLLEGMLLGVPFLATDTAGSIEIFKTNSGGVLVSNSENGLYSGLFELFSDRKKLTALKSKVHYVDNKAEVMKAIYEVI
ncbi:glycosyltransferase [Breznakia sp. OttesenSCG-928-G09]|nr:glycosyltransferase [Breznakia sp. OttesenSCG-928-G09]